MWCCSEYLRNSKSLLTICNFVLDIKLGFIEIITLYEVYYDICKIN